MTDPTLSPRVPRPQDIAYEETMSEETKKRKKRQCAMPAMQNPQAQADTACTDLLKVLSHLATIVTDNWTASDVSEPPAELRTGTPGISSLGPISSKGMVRQIFAPHRTQDPRVQSRNQRKDLQQANDLMWDG